MQNKIDKNAETIKLKETEDKNITNNFEIPSNLNK